MGNAKNGRQIGAEYVELFNKWIAKRDSLTDWTDYVRGGKLNRTEIAAECGFDRGVLQTNPAIKAALTALEARLGTKGIVSPKVESTGLQKASGTVMDVASEEAVEHRLAAAKSRDDRRIKSLEEQNAVLIAEVSRLKEQIRKYKLIDDHLAETGRMIRS